MNIKKTITISIMLCLGIVGNSFARERIDPTSPFGERIELIKKYNNNSFSLGWYIGAVDDFEIRGLLDRFLPLSNSLTKKLDKLVVLEPSRSDVEIAKEAKNGNLDAVYTSALIGAELIKFGWVPVIGRTNSLYPVVLSLSSSNIKETKDLKGKRLMGIKGSTTLTFTRYGLIKENVMKIEDKSIVEVMGSQQELVSNLNDKSADGVIMRDIIAKKLIKDNPNKYKIVYSAPEAAGHMLFINEKMNATDKDIIVNYFMNLTPGNKGDIPMLKALDGFSNNDANPFIQIDEKNLSVAKELLIFFKSEKLN